MSQFELEDTEETLTCLRLTVYHPKQQEKQVFRNLEFCKPLQLKADDVVKFGRDSNICQFNLVDDRASRTQFSLQFFRPFGNSEFGFEIKNLSKKVKLVVDNIELAYLNKIELPETCTARFGEYEMLMERQRGESENYFNIYFELAKHSILQQKPSSLRLPIVESGILCTDSPIEMDEDE